MKNANETKTCRRCNGAGEYRGYGMCYGCQGRGVVVVKRVISDEDRAADRAAYEAGEAARAARKAERDATRAERQAINAARREAEAR